MARDGKRAGDSARPELEAMPTSKVASEKIIKLMKAVKGAMSSAKTIAEQTHFISIKVKDESAKEVTINLSASNFLFMITASVNAGIVKDKEHNKSATQLCDNIYKSCECLAKKLNAGGASKIDKELKDIVKELNEKYGNFIIAEGVRRTSIAAKLDIDYANIRGIEFSVVKNELAAHSAVEAPGTAAGGGGAARREEASSAAEADVEVKRIVVSFFNNEDFKRNLSAQLKDEHRKVIDGEAKTITVSTSVLSSVLPIEVPEGCEATVTMDVEGFAKTFAKTVREGAKRGRG